MTGLHAFHQRFFIFASASLLCGLPRGAVLAQDVSPPRIGPTSEVSGSPLGYIGRLAVARDGMLFVHDVDASEIIVLRPDGRSIGTIGPAAETDYPKGMSLGDDDRLYVIRAARQAEARITTYEIHNGRLVQRRERIVRTPGVDLCVAADRVFLLTIGGATLIKEVAPNGEIIGEFGAPVRPPADLADAFDRPSSQILNDGLLSCDGSRGRLLYASLRIGEVRMYTLDGKLLWSRQLEDFLRLQMTVSSRHGACCVFHMNPRTNTRHLAVAAMVTEGLVYISLHEWGPRSVERYSIRTLAGDDGRELSRIESEMALSGLMGDSVLGYRQAPASRIAIAPWTPAVVR